MMRTRKICVAVCASVFCGVILVLSMLAYLEGQNKPSGTIFQNVRDVPPLAVSSEWFSVQHWLGEDIKRKGEIYNLSESKSDWIRDIERFSDADTNANLAMRYRNYSPSFDLWGFWSVEPRRIEEFAFTVPASWAFEEKRLCQFYGDGSVFSYNYEFTCRHRTRLDWWLISRRKDVSAYQYFGRDGCLLGYNIYYNSGLWSNVYVWSNHVVTEEEYWANMYSNGVLRLSTFEETQPQAGGYRR